MTQLTLPRSRSAQPAEGGSAIGQSSSIEQRLGCERRDMFRAIWRWLGNTESSTARTVQKLDRRTPLDQAYLGRHRYEGHDRVGRT